LALPVTVKLIRASKDILIPNSLTSFNKKKNLQFRLAVQCAGQAKSLHHPFAKLTVDCSRSAEFAPVRRPSNAGKRSLQLPRRSAIFNFGRELGQTVALARP